MTKFWLFLKAFLVVLCLIAVFYLSLQYEYFSSLFNLPYYLIPFLSILLILYIGYIFIDLYLNQNEIEHDFTTIVNHTFRTPLTRINWISKELEKDLSQNERLSFTQNLNNATGRLIEIVDLIAGIKDIKDKTGYIFQATSIRDIIEKSIAKYRDEINKKNLKFQVSTFKDIPMLTVDLKKITFVVDSIVENAIIYTKKNSNISVECILKNNKLILSVSDEGPGLSFQDRMKIFSRFFRSKQALLVYPDGMGLKLSLARDIMRRHNGKIYARSKGKDLGSTFFIELPFNGNI